MLDLLIVLAFVAWSVAAGLRSRRRASRDLDEYFLAGRRVPGWQAGLSMAATQFAADTPLLVTGLVASAGVFMLWRLWIYGLAFLLMAFVLAALWRRARVLTDAELTEIRYSGRGVLWLRVLKAVYYGTLVNCVVMAIVLVASVRVAEVFLPWHLWLPAGLYQPLQAAVTALGPGVADSVTGLAPAVAATNAAISIALMLLFVALYSTTGGLRGVIVTDVTQFAVAMVATLAYVVVAVGEAGGLGGLTARVTALYGEAEAGRLLGFAPPAGELLLPFVAVIGLQWLFQINADGTGYLAQRSLACASDRDARVAGVVFAFAQVLLRSLLWLVLAVSLLVLYPFTPADAGADGFVAARELTFVTGAAELLPAGLSGLMLAGLIAALASTLDTHLNWGASYWTNDLYRRLVCEAWLRREPRPRELVRVARLSNALLIGLALLVMAHLGSVQQAWLLSLLFGAGMGAVLVMRWLWERVNLWSEALALGASLVAAPLLLWLVEAEWLRLAAMAAVSTTAAVTGALLGPPTDPERLADFYRRVRPVGWWPQTAAAVGEDPAAPWRRLTRAMSLVGLAAASLFLGLCGLGRLLVPPPGASTALSLAMTAAALLLVPAWWRGLRERDPAPPAR